MHRYTKDRSASGPSFFDAARCPPSRPKGGNGLSAGRAKEQPDPSGGWELTGSICSSPAAISQRAMSRAHPLQNCSIRD